MDTTTDDQVTNDLDDMAALSYPGYDLYFGRVETGTTHDQLRAVTARKMRSLYASGHPLLTRAALEELSHQLRSVAAFGGTVRVNGLDGTPVGFKVEIGRTCQIGHGELEWVVVAPMVQYVPFDGMVADEESYPYNGRLAYCNLRIVQQRKVRDRISGEILTPSLPSRDDLRSYFRRVRETWSESEACSRVKAIIESSRPRCSKIVAFALGSLSWELKKGWRPRSAFQHALLLSLRKALQACRPKGGTVQCIVQDPAYTELDRALLHGSGITTVDDPDGFLQLDDSSAMLSCSPDIPVKEIVSEIALPALIIWDTVGDMIDDSKSRTRTTDPHTPRVREMLRCRYDRVEFPGESDQFGDLSFYIRR